MFEWRRMSLLTIYNLVNLRLMNEPLHAEDAEEHLSESDDEEEQELDPN